MAEPQSPRRSKACRVSIDAIAKLDAIAEHDKRSRVDTIDIIVDDYLARRPDLDFVAKAAPKRSAA